MSHHYGKSISSLGTQQSVFFGRGCLNPFWSQFPLPPSVVAAQSDHQLYNIVLYLVPCEVHWGLVESLEEMHGMETSPWLSLCVCTSAGFSVCRSFCLSQSETFREWIFVKIRVKQESMLVCCQVLLNNQYSMISTQHSVLNNQYSKSSAQYSIL